MRYGGLIAAVIIAAIAAVIVLRMGNSQPAPQAQQAAPKEEVKSTQIYVAAKPIPVGTVITSEMVSPQPWPQHLVLEGFVPVKEGATVVGMVARGSFQLNEPLITSKLANPSDPNFLAGELPKGMRVVSIPLNEVDGVAGFIFPGDHVDVMYTHEVDKPKAVAEDGTQRQADKVQITETLLTNVKVMAVDQRASGQGSTDKEGRLMIPKSASLMVTQADAQRARLAQKTGSLSLTLRAISDRDAKDGLFVTAPKDVSQKVVGDVAGAEPVVIVRGAPKQVKEKNTDTSILRGGATGNGLSFTNPGRFTDSPNPSPVVTP